MIGVDYEQFWTLNPKSLTSFIKAFELKSDYDDMCAWRDGMYIQMAIASCFNKEAKYPTEPFHIIEKKRSAHSKPEYIKARMEQQAEIINMRFEKEG